MGPGSFGTGKAVATDGYRLHMVRDASMGPGSFGTGKAEGHLGRGSPHGSASMGPGSFGTGKAPLFPLFPLYFPSSFNGARFFWNREGARSLKVAQSPSTRLLQWGPVLLEPGRRRSRRPRSWRSGRLQWGPVLLEPGRPRSSPGRTLPRRVGFNGARFFWNREARWAWPGHAGGLRGFNGARFFWNREASPYPDI